MPSDLAPRIVSLLRRRKTAFAHEIAAALRVKTPRLRSPLKRLEHGGTIEQSNRSVPAAWPKLWKLKDAPNV